MSTPTLITFILYFIVLLAIGLYFYRKNQNIEDYLLGGRSMGAWVTALSAQASDMSGWLLMALPGAVYLAGLSAAWIPIGLFIGTVLNWGLVSGRLRLYTQMTNSITLPSFFEARFADPTGLLRTVSAILILMFFTIYTSSGLVATGRLFEPTFNIPYQTAVLIGGSVIIAYTFLGGFMAVCWTDLFQGLLMLAALLVVPALAYHKVGGIDGILQAIDTKGLTRGLIPKSNDRPSVLIILSAMAWGLGYFGQPHILARFMSVRSLSKLRQSMRIAVVWVALSLTGAVVIGLIGIGMYDSLDAAVKEHEKVFIYMIGDVMSPWLGGLMLAAILSAIMSTMDSQLLVSSSALSEDFYQKVIKRGASEKEVVWVGRFCVIVISLIAMVLAFNPKESILQIVAYAWGGFGAAFGPVIVFALFARKTTWQSALLGMITGTVVLVVWAKVGLSPFMYEIVPGFAANALTIFLVNQFMPQKDPSILKRFQEVVTHETDRR